MVVKRRYDLLTGIVNAAALDMCFIMAEQGAPQADQYQHFTS